MNKIKQLHRFLVELDMVRAERIQSFVDEPKFIPSGKIVNHGAEPAILLCRQEYTATFNIDEFPHKKHSPLLLFAQVSAWLLENDTERTDIAEPETNVEVIDNNSANVEFSIIFTEDVYGAEDPAGPLQLNGKRYRLADVNLDYAETGDVRT